MNFIEAYLEEVFSNLSNDYNDNWDHLRFGRQEEKLSPGIKQKFRGNFRRFLNRKGYYNKIYFSQVSAHLKEILKSEFLYDNLESDADRKLLLQVLAYRTLGYKKVKLPLNTPAFWQKIKSLEKLSDTSDSINPRFLDFKLNKINLHPIGFPIEFYFTPGGIMIDFIVKQYEYHVNGVTIKAEKGDVVIDGGGCWGDTALFFANEVGNTGKVFSFEFIPNNIRIFEKNIALNPQLKESIDLVRHPLWKDSVTQISFIDNGPGSKVSLEPLEQMDGSVNTLSIDDLVAQKNVDKVDFIKMDIEGAETNAILGAAETIKKCKPKLAIALYHSMDDFQRIPLMLKEMVPEYKFYFSHCSLNSEESVLFAKLN